MKKKIRRQRAVQIAQLFDLLRIYDKISPNEYPSLEIFADGSGLVVANVDEIIVSFQTLAEGVSKMLGEIGDCT